MQPLQQACAQRSHLVTLGTALILWFTIGVVITLGPAIFADDTSRVEYAQSLYQISETEASDQPGKIIRQLDSEERLLRQPFSIALKLRDRDRLQSRVARGEILSLEQLQQERLR